MNCPIHNIIEPKFIVINLKAILHMAFEFTGLQSILQSDFEDVL